MWSISVADSWRTTPMTASSSAPAFFLAASTALSADPIATLKNWNVGAVVHGGTPLGALGLNYGYPGDRQLDDPSGRR